MNHYFQTKLCGFEARLLVVRRCGAVAMPHVKIERVEKIRKRRARKYATSMTKAAVIHCMRLGGIKKKDSNAILYALTNLCLSELHRTDRFEFPEVLVMNVVRTTPWLWRLDISIDDAFVQKLKSYALS